MKFFTLWHCSFIASFTISVSASTSLRGTLDQTNTKKISKANNGEQTWPIIKKPFPFGIQSPNNINTRNAKSDLCLAPICILNTANLPEEAITIKNTGRTLEIVLRDQSLNSRPTITGGPLFDDHYMFEQMHFHWGKSDSCGSEHRVNGKWKSPLVYIDFGGDSAHPSGKRFATDFDESCANHPYTSSSSSSYSTEIHVVFFNEKYPSFEAAKNYSDGVTVLSFFGQHSKLDNPDFAHLVTKINLVRESGSEIRGSFKRELKFVKVLLLQQSKYYAFPGSLTTPDYQECVTWIMYTNPFLISSKQLNAFRRLMRDDGLGMIRENDRELQAFGKRPVISSLIDEKIIVRPIEPNSSYFLEDVCPPNPCEEK